jgi:preprotein translocase subunit SecG
MEQILLVAHLLIAFGIIGLIMLQQGKGADMGASFGAGASQTLFGSEGGGNVLSRGTAILATAFFVTSFGLAIVAKDKAADVGEVDIPVPMSEQTELGMESDMPLMDEDLPPVVTEDSEIPEVE